MGTPGLPPGAVLKPIQGAGPAPAAPPAAASGLPPGAVVKPISQPAAASSDAGAQPSFMDSATDFMAGDGTADALKHGTMAERAKAGMHIAAAPVIGAAKGIGDTVHTVSSLLNKIPVVGETLAPKEGVEKFDKMNESNGALETGGKAAEMVLEFMLGDEALKGMSLAEKLRHATPIVKAFEKFPMLMRAVTTGLRQGTVATGQNLAHGEDLPDALEHGAAAGATGGLLDLGIGGAQKLYSKIKPGTTTIAGETMPKLASQEAEHAPIADKVAPITSAPKVAAAQQKGTQQAVKNVAREAAANSVSRVNATRVPTTEEVPISKPSVFEKGKQDTNHLNKALEELGGGKLFGELTPKEQSTVMMRAEELKRGAAPAKPTVDQGLSTRAESAQIGSTAKTVPESVMPKNKLTEEIGSTAATVPRQVLEPKAAPEPRTITVDREVPAKFDKVTPDTAKVNTFADAADHVENAAKPVYQKLDEVSGGKFTALREQRKAALKVLRDPASIDAWEKAQEKLTEAESGIDDLFKTHSDEVGRTDLKAANLAWKDAKTLDKVHTAVERAFNGVPENVASRTGVARKISGDTLRRSMGNLLEKSGQEEIERVIGKAGVDNLYRIAHLTSKPESLAATKDVAKNVAMYLSHRFGTGGVVGGAIGSLIGHTATGALAGASLQDATMRILHEAAVNPRVGKLIADAVKVGASPKLYSALISTALIQKDKSEK